MKRTVIIAVFFLAATALFGQNSKAKESGFTPYFALSYQPWSFWGVFNLLDNEENYLGLDMDATFMTKAEFDITHKSGFKFGISADFTRIPFTRTDRDDNFIDKFSTLAGKLGYKNFILQVTNSRIKGTGTWNNEDWEYAYERREKYPDDYDIAELIPLDQSESFEFNYDYFSLDLLAFTWIDLFYLGANYTKFSFPFALEDSSDNFYVYDPELSFAGYGITMWFDSLHFLQQRGDTGSKLWFESTTRLNFGFLKFSETGKSRIETVKANKIGYSEYEMTDNNFPTIFAQLDWNLGFLYLFKKIPLAISAGYNGMGLSFAFAQILYRHGFIIKGSIMF